MIKAKDQGTNSFFVFRKLFIFKLFRLSFNCFNITSIRFVNLKKIPQSRIKSRSYMAQQLHISDSKHFFFFKQNPKNSGGGHFRKVFLINFLGNQVILSSDQNTIDSVSSRWKGIKLKAYFCFLVVSLLSIQTHVEVELGCDNCVIIIISPVCSRYLSKLPVKIISFQ